MDKEKSLKKFKGTLTFNNQDIINGKVIGQFTDNKKLKFTVETNKDEKITTLFLDKAVPIVNRYKFIKGFEEGVLDFYSTKKGTNSLNLIPSPDKRSAIPCKEAKVNSLVRAGNSFNLKS